MMHISKQIHAIFHPEEYHGWNKRKKFFEGWYFKIVDDSEKWKFAIIPGVAMDKSGEKHAFIQVLDAIEMKQTYTTFPFEEFTATPNKFEISIGDNYFSEHKLSLNLDSLSGELNFENQVPWSSSYFSPNIMGPLTFMPFMQCNHGILSMNHSVSGYLNSAGENINFNKGKGYLEKDWGKSFPNAYVWLQTNHFSKKQLSMKMSVAKIPYLGTSFTGFIAGVWFNNELIEFTTYNFSRLKSLAVEKDNVKVLLTNRKYILDLQIERGETTMLKAPFEGSMIHEIEESMNAVVHLKLIDKKTNTLIIEDSGSHAGLEVAGKIETLLKF